MSATKRHWSIPPNRRRLLLVILLVLTNVTTAVLLVRLWWTNWLAQNELYGFATYAGAMQAHADYGNGVRRQYELVADIRSGFTSRHDGPFGVWRWTYYPNLGQSKLFANKAFVETYNSKMKFMQQHPEQFRPDEVCAHNPQDHYR
jgi:hypothetical protein